MIISCPSCQKRYLVDDTVLSDQGRDVRCGACGVMWNESSKIPAISISSIEIDTVFGETRLKKKSRAIPSFFLGLTIITIFFTAVYIGRFPILQALPSLRPLFEHVGIKSTHPTEGLSLSSLKPLQTTIKDQPAIVIKGILSNSALETREVSELEIILYGSCSEINWLQRLYQKLAFLSVDDGKCRVDHWTHALSQSRLLPGENLVFETLPRSLNTVPTSLHIDF